jgi:hypothetical protein
MKQLTKGLNLRMLLTFLMIAILQTVVLAQEEGQGSGTPSIGSGSSTTTTTKSVVSHSSDWYASPWVWVVGAAVFILLLVALLRGGSSTRSERVTVTKSTRAE